MRPVFLNGRFLDQPMTGVQRFSTEVAAAIDNLAAVDEWMETTILAPCARPAAIPNGRAPCYRRLRFKAVGRTRGHLWEQAELPGAARGGVLVSLGNTAPVLAGRRQVVVIHDAGIFDTPESYSLRFRSWYKLLQHGLIRTGAQIVTVSNFSRRRIAACLGSDPARIAVINEGAEHVLRVAADPGTLARHDLTPRGFALVIANRAAHKDLASLHDAAAVLAKRGIVTVLVGGGDPSVFRAVPGTSLPERRLGRVSDAELRSLYENAVCLLFPSRYEGFGLPPIEAMACGCPVLAARSGAVAEICRDSVLYFTTGDRASIVQAVEQLLDTPGLSDEMRVRGPAHAAGLTWSTAARALGDVVRQLH